MNRYINDDKMPKRPRRVMTKISKNELWRKMCESVNLMEFSEWNDSYMIEEFTCYNVLEKILHECESVFIDMKTIQVDSENITCTMDNTFGDDVVGTPMLGLQTINNDYTFFGFEIGGDWEYPLFAIIYYDGEKIRAYIPNCGNVVNLDFNCALGSELGVSREEESKFKKMTEIYSKVFAENPKRGIFYTDILEDGEQLEACYQMKYDLDVNPENFGFNWKLIQMDIQKMFILK